MLTCDNCLSGRHCRGRIKCACSICATIKTKWTAKPTRTKRVQAPKKETVPKEKKERKRAYPPEVLAEAARLRFEGKSWTEVGRVLQVPVEGIRYALNSYGPNVTPSPPGKPLATRLQSRLSSDTADFRVKLTRAELQQIIDALESA